MRSLLCVTSSSLGFARSSEMKRTLKPDQMERKIRELLDAAVPDAELRERLEQLAEEVSFNGFTWLWGPILYQRNRVLFRPFILSHFSNFLIRPNWRWAPVKWKGDLGRALDRWLEAVDRNDDVELFRRLYPWKLTPPGKWQLDQDTLRAELKRRFQAASSRVERETVLRKFDLWFELDEAMALEFYSLEPAAAGPFIFRHLPTRWGWAGEKRALWTRLFARARQQKDDDFAWKLYRRQVRVEQWEKEARELSHTIADANELVQQLEQRHPEGGGLDLGNVYHWLLAQRGRDVFPYVGRHLLGVRRMWFGLGSYGKLIDLAREKGWFDLWAALVRTCANAKVFNDEAGKLLLDHKLPDEEVLRRLRALAGVSREWNWPGLGIARVHQLDEPTSLAMYQRFPALLHRAFKANVQIAPWGSAYPRLIDRFVAEQDEEMIDYMASRVVTRGSYRYQGNVELLQEADRLWDHYDALKRKDESVFSRRAANVLSQVPAFSIFSYHNLIRTNRLARLLFERSASAYLADAVSLRDLVEASEIHVMALAYRALGLDEDRARALAADNLPLLMGTLLRPLQRSTRALAFGALANAATTPDNARLILQRAREAMDLPDKRYPKEKLIGLIGQLLHRWPELRGAREQPVVYAEAA